MNVCHLARGNIVEIKGGPLLTVHLMMKTKEIVDPPGVGMFAIFGNRIARSYRSEIAPIIEQYNQRRGDPLIQRVAAKIFPRTLRFLGDLGLSGLRFTYLLRRGINSNRQSALVLHTHDPLSGYLCGRFYYRKHPRLHTVHGKAGSVKEPLLQYPVLQGTPVEKFWRHMERLMVKRADVMVFTSKGSQALFEEEYPGMLQGVDVRIVYPGVDIDELKGAAYNSQLLAKHGVKEGNFVILCVTKLVIEKGIDTLIDAIALLPENIRSKLSCLIVGRGHLEEELTSRAREKGLLDMVKSATVFVLPARVAVFDYALLEAAAMKLPIITSSVGGNLEMFPDNSARLIPPEKPKILAEAIAQVLTDNKLRKDLAQRAYERVRSVFSLEAMLKNYLAIYEELARRYYQNN